MNLQCVSAKKQYGAEGEKIQITTLQLCETEEKTLLTLFIIKFERRSEQGAAPKKQKKISEKAWQMFTQITNLNLPLRFFPSAVYI